MCTITHQLLAVRYGLLRAGMLPAVRKRIGCDVDNPHDFGLCQVDFKTGSFPMHGLHSSAAAASLGHGAALVAWCQFKAPRPLCALLYWAGPS